MSARVCCRQPRKCPAEPVHCSQLLEAKGVMEASRKKQQKQLERLKQQLHVPVAQSVRDALRKQVGLPCCNVEGGFSPHVQLCRGAVAQYLAVQLLNRGLPS